MDFEYARHVFISEKYRSVVGSILDEAVAFFNTTPVHSLPPPERFIGPGVYAIYYLGDHELYAPIAAKNRIAAALPLYVGEAVPQGSRKGNVESFEGGTLRGRLRDHGRSIRQTKNLDLGEFRCRFMVLTGIESPLILPVETALVRRYQPLWNVLIDGFGNHDPGAGRYDQRVSEWDTLHPGRRWVEKLTGGGPTVEQVELKVRTFFGRSGLL